LLQHQVQGCPITIDFTDDNMTTLWQSVHTCDGVITKYIHLK